MLAGCATTGGGGEDPTEAIASQVDSYAKAMQSQDIDAIMKHFSEDFEHYEWGDKEGAQDFLQETIDMGYLEDLEVETGDMEIEVEGTEATVYPAELSGDFGTVSLELTYAKGAKGWSIIGLETSGM